MRRKGSSTLLSESVASAKILLLVNYRPEYRHEWGQKTYYTQLRLAPFGKAEAEEFLDALLGTTVEATCRRLYTTSQAAHPGEDRRHAVLHGRDRAGRWWSKACLSATRRQLPARDATDRRCISPTTVQGVLAARIDRLAPDEKALLQQLAVIGREFPLSLIRQVITQPEEELYRLLASLQRKEFLYEQPAFPEVEYIFKHALTQEVAYNSVLHERRKALHEHTAQAIEAAVPRPVGRALQ